MPSEQSDVADELIRSAGGLAGVSHYCPDLSRYAFVLLQIQIFRSSDWRTASRG